MFLTIEQYTPYRGALQGGQEGNDPYNKKA